MSGPWKRKTTMLLALTVFCLAAGSVKADATSKKKIDLEIEQIFMDGAMQLAEATFRIEREGTTTILYASAPSAASPVSQTLVCALCTPLEVNNAAWSVGRRLAAATGLALDDREYSSSVSHNIAQQVSPKVLRNRRIAVSLGGFGVAVAAAGAVLLAFDDSCASSNLDKRGNCLDLHDTGALGWSFVGSGLAMATFGLIWGIITGRADSNDAVHVEEEDL